MWAVGFFFLAYGYFGFFSKRSGRERKAETNKEQLFTFKISETRTLRFLWKKVGYLRCHQSLNRGSKLWLNLGLATAKFLQRRWRAWVTVLTPLNTYFTAFSVKSIIFISRTLSQFFFLDFCVENSIWNMNFNTILSVLQPRISLTWGICC